MTIIVWDGNVLATDCAATDGAAKWETIKAWYHEDARGRCILSGAGPVQTILSMREWYKRGADPDLFPFAQLSPDWCQFVVVTSEGLSRYEQGPYSIHHGNAICAFGEGRDFAYGALAMGATAARAVEICNKFSNSCGLGTRVYWLLET